MRKIISYLLLFLIMDKELKERAKFMECVS